MNENERSILFSHFKQTIEQGSSLAWMVLSKLVVLTIFEFSPCRISGNQTQSWGLITGLARAFLGYPNAVKAP